MITFKDLGIKLSDIINFDPHRVYSKRDKCLFGGRIYISNSDNNKNDSPILGIKWDQIL